MKVLGIETTGEYLGLALWEKKPVAALYNKVGWRHEYLFFPSLEKLLKKAGWSFGSLQGVGVCIGPGRFTGIRVGLVAARALGQALRVPVVGVRYPRRTVVKLAPSSGWLNPERKENLPVLQVCILASRKLSKPMEFDIRRLPKPYYGAKAWVNPQTGRLEFK